MRNRISLILLFCCLISACQHENPCRVTIGETNFSIDPNTDANYAPLFHVGGYIYLTGGHHGVVVVRTALTEFVAYERTCPCNNHSRVEMSKDWSGLLECPECHTLFNVYNFGYPMDGGATSCPLYQYSTTYDGSRLYVY
ncbi:MAG: hypothetical protein MJZ62_04345 [Bacteroidales bacterium]|nr:hypothetical protein [Bacteroidales bacterium]